jgi:hypothetical protein
MTTRPFPLQPKSIHVANEQLADLNTRLKATRWPLDARNDDWYYGVSKAYWRRPARRHAVPPLWHWSWPGGLV